MKQYKSSDFVHLPPQHDTLIWTTKDLRFTITTTTNQYSQFFVYVNLGATDEWLEVKENSLDDAINKLNEMIESGKIDQYVI